MNVSVLLPAEERFDGSGGAVAHWVKHVYPRKDYNVEVVCPSPSARYAPDLRFANGTALQVVIALVRMLALCLSPVVGRSKHVIFAKLTVGGLWYVALAHRRIRSAQIIHVHNRPRYALKLRRRGFRGAIVLHMHNSYDHGVRGAVIRDLTTAVDEFVYCSDYLRAEATALGFPPGETVHNGVDCPSIVPEKSSSRWVFAGRLIPEKGALEAIQLAADVREQTGVPIELHVLGSTGSGEDFEVTSYLQLVRDAARACHEKFGGPTIHLRGFLAHEEMMQELAAASLLVYPVSWAEPFGFVVVEAMSCATPVVAYGRGGVIEVIGGDGGVVVDPDAGRSKMMGELESLVRDPQRITSLGRSARARAQSHFSWSCIGSQLDVVLERAAARPQAVRLAPHEADHGG